MKDLKLYVKTVMKQNRQNLKNDTQLCEKISEKYLPLGLEPMIPQNLLQFCKEVKGSNIQILLQLNDLYFINYVFKS